jgi:hypothetical protein
MGMTQIEHLFFSLFSQPHFHLLEDEKGSTTELKTAQQRVLELQEWQSR